MKDAVAIVVSMIIWVVGLVLIAKGAWTLCPPAGMIVAGIELIIIAVALTSTGGD